MALQKKRDPKNKFYLNKSRNNVDIFYDDDDDFLKNVPFSSIYKPREMLRRMQDEDAVKDFTDMDDREDFGGQNPDGASYDLSVRQTRERRARFTRSSKKRMKFDNSVGLMREGSRTKYRLENLFTFRPDLARKRIINDDQSKLEHNIKKVVQKPDGGAN
jgi:hypothetical protein